ncbi:MAG: tetratricopeptide repeat protein, partial [Myxococcales bacterium]|nr:tetratricopeptide repeat protein [Myxococcales bacterium]
MAGALLAAARAGEALEVVGARLGEQPKDVDALVLAGRAWMERGDLLRAQKTLLQAARFDAAHPDPYRWLGEVLLRRGDPDRAQKVLARARALGALDPEVRRLHERATRLARIASESMADADEDGTTAERPLPSEPPPPTSDVTRRAPQPVPPPRPAPRPPAGRPSPFDEPSEPPDEATVVASNLSQQIAEASRRLEAEPPDAVDDDAPTSMLGRDDIAAVQAAIDARRGAASAPGRVAVADDPFGADPFGEDPPTKVKAK